MNGNQGFRLPPDPEEDLPTATELWYLECLKRWIAAKGRSPVIRELARACRKSNTAVQSALQALESKGYVERVGGEGRLARRFKPVTR